MKLEKKSPDVIGKHGKPFSVIRHKGKYLFINVKYLEKLKKINTGYKELLRKDLDITEPEPINEIKIVGRGGVLGLVPFLLRGHTGLWVCIDAEHLQYLEEINLAYKKLLKKLKKTKKVEKKNMEMKKPDKKIKTGSKAKKPKPEKLKKEKESKPKKKPKKPKKEKVKPKTTEKPKKKKIKKEKKSKHEKKIEVKIEKEEIVEEEPTIEEEQMEKIEDKVETDPSIEDTIGESEEIEQINEEEKEESEAEEEPTEEPEDEEEPTSEEEGVPEEETSEEPKEEEEKEESEEETTEEPEDVEEKEPKSEHVYCYCILPKKKIKNFEISGFENRDVHSISFKNIKAVVSNSSLTEYKLTEENAKTHGFVVKKIMEENDTVVPMAFGMVFKNEKVLRGVLKRAYSDIKRALGFVKNRVELGIKIINLDGVQFDLDAFVQDIKELRNIAKGVKLGVKFSDKMLLNASYLVDKDKIEEFSEQIEHLEEKHKELKIRYTGPWPVYNFVNIKIGGER